MAELFLEGPDKAPVLYRATFGVAVPYQVTLQRNGVMCKMAEVQEKIRERGVFYQWLMGILPAQMEWEMNQIMKRAPTKEAYLRYRDRKG